MVSTMSSRISVWLLGLVGSASIGLFVPAGFASDDPAPKPKEDSSVEAELRRLEGEWRVERTNWTVGAVEVSGKEAEALGLAWEFKDGVATFIKDDQRASSYSITLNPGGDPKTVEMEILNYPRRPVTFLGVYELDEDRLRIRYSMKTRPEGFNDDPDSGEIDWTLVRRKPEG